MRALQRLSIFKAGGGDRDRWVDCKGIEDETAMEGAKRADFFIIHVEEGSGDIVALLRY